MWDDARQLNVTAAALATIASILLVWGALSWGARSPSFAFREVVIRGASGHVNVADLDAVIRFDLTGTFFTMDLDRARASFAKVPWVRAVALRRQWPQQLEVTVEEHVPVARWNDAALVNTHGEVFIADYAGELPQFAGPDGRAADVASRYGEWSEALAPLALAVQSVRLSPRGGWQIAAKSPSGNLVIEMGREDPAARLARFIAAYERTIGALAQSGTRIDHVDLRYRNGFAARVPGFRERAPKRVT